MCGVVGLRNLAGDPVDQDLLERMTSTLQHRGPDDSATWVQGAVGLGHTRLSIIDTQGSSQPMQNAAGLHLVFNGEILNYQELRRDLDEQWTTAGDTETLLAQLAREGADGLLALRGQFAFGCYDSTDGTLLLARDRLGILPLFYTTVGGHFAFASEIKALLPLFEHWPEPTDTGLGHYLLTGAVRAPGTLLDGVHKVRPGHALTVDADGHIEERPYWRLQPSVVKRSDADARTELDRLLRRAVDYALVADVPVGSYLSGGLDSSLIAALVKQQRPDVGLHTFSAAFAGAAVDEDETSYARLISRHVGTDHHSVVVRPEDFHAAWERLSWVRDAPLSQPADVAVAALAAAAREHVVVVLSGEGADELFAGYPKHRADRVLAPMTGLPRSAKDRLRREALARLPRNGRRLRIAVDTLSAQDELERFTTWFAPFSHPEIAALLGDDVDVRGSYAGAVGDLRIPGASTLTRMLALDLVTWLPDNLLERGDRMTMSASVELRPPFLDPDVVDFAFSLPDRQKIRGRQGKWLLKQVALPYLPAEIVLRPKAGFKVPLARWFREGLRDVVCDLLLDERSLVRERMDASRVEAMLTRHLTGGADESARIWNLASLEMWYRGYRKRARPADLGRPEQSS